MTTYWNDCEFTKIIRGLDKDHRKEVTRANAFKKARDYLDGLPPTHPLGHPMQLPDWLVAHVRRIASRSRCENRENLMGGDGTATWGHQVLAAVVADYYFPKWEPKHDHDFEMTGPCPPELLTLMRAKLDAINAEFAKLEADPTTTDSEPLYRIAEHIQSLYARSPYADYVMITV